MTCRSRDTRTSGSGIFLPAAAYAALDRAWGHDPRWEYEVVEHIRNGLAAPRPSARSTICFRRIRHSLIPAGRMPRRRQERGSSKAAFLNDEAIAVRAAERERVKEAPMTA